MNLRNDNPADRVLPCPDRRTRLSSTGGRTARWQRRSGPYGASERAEVGKLAFEFLILDGRAVERGPRGCVDRDLHGWPRADHPGRTD